MQERFLVVVDESPGSKRALDYGGRVLGGRRNFAIILLHLLPPLPPELLEFGGAENPRKEQKLEAELRVDQQAWIRSARTSAKSFLTSAIQQLHKQVWRETQFTLRSRIRPETATPPPPSWSMLAASGATLS